MKHQPDYKTMSPEVFRGQLRMLLANRGTIEAAALFDVVLRYIHKRVLNVSRTCGGHLSSSRIEELVADVLLQLMDGGLARFKGGSLPELLGFVRTISDRSTWRAIRRFERERNALSDAGVQNMDRWTGSSPRPDAMELVPDSPLSANDQGYLLKLLEAGSKAELARKAGVSRAAVTQRVQRIRARIEALSAHDRMAHDVWMTQEARHALEATAPEL